MKTKTIPLDTDSHIKFDNYDFLLRCWWKIVLKQGISPASIKKYIKKIPDYSVENIKSFLQQYRELIIDFKKEKYTPIND